jgi:hypothetical protein
MDAAGQAPPGWPAICRLSRPVLRWQVRPDILRHEVIWLYGLQQAQLVALEALMLAIGWWRSGAPTAVPAGSVGRTAPVWTCNLETHCMSIEGSEAAIDQRATARTRARYDRNAPFYDLMTRGSEKRLAKPRAEMWKRVRGPRVLEVGVGTGINMQCYPPDADHRD